MIEFILVESMDASTAAIEDAPEFIFNKVRWWVFHFPFFNFVVQGFEWILDKKVQPMKD